MGRGVRYLKNSNGIELSGQVVLHSVGEKFK